MEGRGKDGWHPDYPLGISGSCSAQFGWEMENGNMTLRKVRWPKAHRMLRDEELDRLAR